MGPDLELQGKSKAEALTGAPVNCENVSLPQDSEAKAMECASNYEDTGFDTETGIDAAQKRDGVENFVVDVTDCTNKSDNGQFDEAMRQDSTEYSSSFGGTLSGADNGVALSDGEVDSQDMNGGIPGFNLHGLSDESQFRKKKLTDHWRKFIQPLRWRCKWLELQIREFQSRAQEYDRLAEYELQKYRAFDNLSPEDFNSKSLAFSGPIKKTNVLKRKRRKKVEQTVDLPSYMSSHNLFSHYEKRSTADRVLVKDGGGNQDSARGILDLGSDDKLEFGDGDASMEQILAKIDMVQSQVHKLKTRIEKVISENPGKFSSINRLTLGIQSSAATNSDQNPSSPPGKSVSQHVSDCDFGDLLMADGASSGRGVASLPDIRESTNQSDDGILINNLVVKEELLSFEKLESQHPENPQEQLEDQNAASPSKVPEAALPVETPSPPEASNVKPRPVLKTYISKRRRRRRAVTARKKSKKS